MTPFGELISDPARGLVYGNRGCLHDDRGHIRRHHNGRRWIACRLSFNARRRAPLMAPGRYTELFFLDEATAMAAGHRPCGECRHADYRRFRRLWGEQHGHGVSADAIDVRLHAERFDPRTAQQRRHVLVYDDLPDGTFVVSGGAPRLVLGERLLTWTPEGYAESQPRPHGDPAVVLTPPSVVEVLRAGWDPVVALIHPSAFAASGRAAGARE
ncbi:MAG: hypothetical protein WAL63_04760 [Solirubrobacteraceae bacterium]